MPFLQTYPLYPDQYIEGQIVDSFPHDIITLANAGGQVKQVDTITVGTAANGTIYTYSAYGQTVQYTSSGAATAAEITTGLVNAIKANSALYGKVVVTSVVGTITLTARLAGTAYAFTSAVSGGGAGYAVANTTPAAEPTVIPFGRAVFSTTADSAWRIGRLPTAAPSATNILRGICIRTNAYESRGIGLAVEEGYPPREPINVMKHGRVAVRVLDAVTPASQVFVVHTGVHAGKFRATADANATALTAAAGTINGGIAFVSAAAAGGLAVININLP